MKPINGFKAEAPSAGFQMLPKGLYIAGIVGAKVEGNEPDQRLVIRVDIIEGEYAGYYTKRYNHDTQSKSQYAPKYKGDFRVQIPNDQNTKRLYPLTDMKRFSNAIWAIEDSNDGYHWDWNEDGLKGKTVGINVQYGEFNGSGFTTIGRLESVKAIREGKATVMADRPPRSDAAEPANASVPAGFVVDDSDIPF